MENKNRFSVLLEYLMSTAGLKNYTLAQALRYDVSYISKWVSGRMVPAERTEKQVLSGISRCIVTSAVPEGLQQLTEDYRVKTPNELELAIYDNLVAEYNYVRETMKDGNSGVNNSIRYYADLPLTKYIEKMQHPVLRRVRSLDVIALMDIMEMNREYRIKICSLQVNAMAAGEVYSDVHFSMVMNLDPEKWNSVYDTVFLLNMLSQMSYVDFSLYRAEQAAGKAVFVVKNDFAMSGMLIDADNCMSVTMAEDSAICNTLYDHTSRLCARENLLFRKSSMNELLHTNEYIRTLLSPNLSWMIGHMTEHFLPEDLFEEIIEQLVDRVDEDNDHITIEEAKRLYQLTQNVIRSSSRKLLFHETAFSNLAVSGELDFFNYKVVLTTEQRIRYMQNLLRLCADDGEGKGFRVLYGRLVSDFQYLANPCLFLSDTVSYIRLDNAGSPNNILVINQPTMQQIFAHFIQDTWLNDEGLVISGKEQVEGYINHIIQGIQLIQDMEEA